MIEDENDVQTAVSKRLLREALAEIDRLQGELRAAQSVRTNIAAWLRATARGETTTGFGYECECLADIADAIEKGADLREAKPEEL